MTKTALPENWFVFKVYGNPTLYGFGTAVEADQYADLLNGDKVRNLYAPHALTTEQAAELNLEDNSEAFSLYDALLAAAHDAE